MATDAELNEYVGLKKLAPYRKGKKRDEWDPKGAEKLREFKGKVQERTGGWRSAGTGAGAGERGGDGGEKKRRKGKKERQKAKLADGDASASVPADGNDAEVVVQNGNGKRSRDDNAVMDGQMAHDPDSKKRKKKRHSRTADIA